ncbi:MAG: hypothetical protein K8T90_07755, partial [Planctomycetes bacterium]|nr:hypothetical protein [Planctomycetota bacterium]
MTDDNDNVTANPGYAVGQLARALTTASTHGDPSIRERARKRIDAWVQVFSGMLTGSLRVGSRTPVEAVPAWATLQVVSGGFATGNLLAGGPLRPHELAIADRLRLPRDGAERAAINGYYVSDTGIDELRSMLTSGAYRIDVPEEGALLTLAWLLDQGHADQAREILDVIGPYFSRLRFFPRPSQRSAGRGDAVHLDTAGRVADALAAIRERVEILKNREAVRVWLPALDRIVGLFLETVEGPTPATEVNGSGRAAQGADGRWQVTGGWPCQKYPDGWRERARAALAAVGASRTVHPLCKRPDRAKGNFGRLRGYLERCVNDPRSLTGRDVGMIRVILAHIVSKRGEPTSDRCAALRATQWERAARPTRKEWAGVVAKRLRTLPPEEGIEAVEPLLSAVTDAESRELGVAAGTDVPGVFRPRLLRCLDASIEWLVAEGVIPSGEALATVMPQRTSRVAAAGMPDESATRLFAEVYEAFRRRRSLLLLNLEHQVRLRELPWVAKLEGHRASDEAARQAAHVELVRVCSVALRAFPQVILPNKLIQEIAALSDRAGLRLPLVEEVAADIFMGTFTEKYLRAAQRAGELLAGSLYETYYGIDFGAVRRIDDVVAPPKAAATSPAFAALCHSRADGATRDARRVGSGNLGRFVPESAAVPSWSAGWSAREVVAGCGAGSGATDGLWRVE